MKKAVILYVSFHHGNTEKVVQYVSETLGIETHPLLKKEPIDLSSYDLIIVASGIYFGQLHDAIFQLLSAEDLQHQEVGILYTCGLHYKEYAKPFKRQLSARGIHCPGHAWCRGYDTMGVLEKIGGIAKHHPNDRDQARIKKKVASWLYES